MTKRQHVVIWVLIAVLMLLAAGTVSVMIWVQRHSDNQVVDFGGPFQLKGSNGELVDSRNLAGKPFAIFFGYTHCPDVCPTTLGQVSHVLGDLGDEAKDLRVFFVTVDPERDTPEVLRDYVGNFDHRIVGLWGTPPEIARVAQEYKIFYQREPTSGDDYLMNHTALVFLMNGKGRLVSAISYAEDYKAYLLKFRELLAGD
jgi:protein SCO1/2